MSAADEPKFEIGDVVQLNSGGPTMTVFKVARDKSESSYVAYCTWFERATSPDSVEWACDVRCLTKV